MTATATAHVVALRRGAVVLGYQLRCGAGGPGQTAYFGAASHGGPGPARLAAVAHAKALGFTVREGEGARGGSPAGRRTRLTRTAAAGIRLEWRPYFEGAALYVLATWQGRDGRARATCYSTERHGLEGALDKAIAARTSAGAPAPDRAALLQDVRRAKRAGADLAQEAGA